MDRHMGKVKRFISAVRRKMSVRAVIMLLLFSVLLAPAVLAANEVVAVLFPAQLRFNGETKAAGQGGQAVLNYDNRVYVPLRFVAESMGADVHYAERSRTVSVKHPTMHPAKSQVVDVDGEQQFMLAIRSAKRHYFQEEALRIWASFTYSGDQEVELAHTTPLIGYEIRDSEGRLVKSERFTEGRSTFRAHDEYRYDLPAQLLRAFNAEHGGEETEMLHDLPQGTYTIAAEARFSNSDRPQAETVLRAEIEVDIH